MCGQVQKPVHGSVAMQASSMVSGASPRGRTYAALCSGPAGVAALLLYNSSIYASNGRPQLTNIYFTLQRGKELCRWGKGDVRGYKLGI